MNDFSQIYPHQRVSVIPGMDVLCYKNAFFQALSRMHHHFPGGSGRFTVVGDDGESLVGPEHCTTFVLKWKNDHWGCVGIEGEGDPSVVAHRHFCLRLHRLSMQMSIAEEKVGFDMQEFVDDVLELTVTILEFPAKLVIEEQHSDFVPSMTYSREELFKLL
jgi:hypothetical protein